ncbi:hypothetical protein [Marinovum sp. B10]|uniref:hypothetical protein n=1 Tax=Marinovum sp. B10 TaxID=3449224 RepID=UPI003EDC76E4
MKHFLTARLAASTAALALMTSAALAEKELRIGLITPPPHVWTQVANRMADSLPDRIGRRAFAGRLSRRTARLRAGNVSAAGYRSA